MIVIETDSHERAFIQLLQRLSIDKNFSRDPELLIEDQLVIAVNNSVANSSEATFNGTDFLIPSAVEKHFSANILEEVKAHYLDLLKKGEKVQWIIQYLKQNEFSKRAIINFWRESHTDLSHKCPCVIYFLFRISKNGLDMSVHMRSNDVNRKTLLNLHLFNAIHKYVAKSLGEKVGFYYHFVDTVIVHQADKDQFIKTQKDIVSSENFFGRN